MAEKLTNTMTSLEAAKGLKQAGAIQMGSGSIGLLSGFAGLQASSMQAKQFKMEGIFLGLQRNAEKLRAREQALFLRKKFLSNVASSTASFAGRSVSTSSGVARAATVEGLRNLALDVKQTELNSKSAQIQLDLRATRAKLAAKTTRISGVVGAAQPVATGIVSLLTGYQAYKSGAAKESLLTKGGKNGS